MQRFLLLGTGLVLVAQVPLLAQVQSQGQNPVTETSLRSSLLGGPALGAHRITQGQITSGHLSLDQIRRAGLEVFTTPFNKLDGFGDGPVNPLDPVSPGGRPTVNGTWLRMNGLDSQTCQECHGFSSMATVPPTAAVAGVGGINATAMPGVTSMDVADADGNGIAEVNGRLINPPFVYGSGGVELVAKEMTVDLQNMKSQAQATPDTPVALVTHGVSFGSITYVSATSSFDTSAVEGVEPDLVVRPFGRKGNNATIRFFDLGAMQFHHGMQPVEIVGAGVDADGDGVANEILPGELSALDVFSVSLERPVQVGANRPAVKRGRELFGMIGCATCHVPEIGTSSEHLDLAYPEVETDPSANVYYTIDLVHGTAHFAKNGQGGIRVEMFSDLKRHDMGPALAETTGDPLDPFFVTPRLWGIGDTPPYLHDGRALTLSEAIEMHGGEGQAAADAFRVLGFFDQQRLLAFLESLRTPTNPAGDIAQPRRL